METKGLRYLFVLCVGIALTMMGCAGNAEKNQPSDVVATARDYHKQGVKYDGQWQMRLAELYYKKSFETLSDDPSQDWACYADAGYRYAYLMLQRGEVEGGLPIISTILKQMEDNKDFPSSQKSALLMLMAYFQQELNQTDEAKKTFAKAYDAMVECDGGVNKGDLNMAITCSSLFHAFCDMGDYDEASKWLRRMTEEFHVYEQNGDSLLIEEYRAHVALDSAKLFQATGRAAEAAAVFDAIPRSRFFNPSTYNKAANYLMSAGRYGECADFYEKIDDTFMNTDSLRHSFDIISWYLSPRYLANRKAGRTAEALQIADEMSAAIDSAIEWQKKNDMAELTVIYQTHEKELALEESRAETRIHRILLVATILVILLISYQLWRSHRNNRILMSKNRKLYAEIEQRRQEQQQEMEELQAAPEEELTTEQQLYRRLCALMEEKQLYTDESMNRDTLASLVGTNAKYVEQAIRQCSKGETVGDFINRYRLERVAYLLKNTDDSIAVIGEMCGIPSRSTLARLFRNAYGMTPTEYRKI